MSDLVPSRSGAEPVSSGLAGPSDGGANLADVLERVLDKGIVIVGDIRVNLLDIELLTIKLRLVIAGVDTARRIGITWWEHDPWLTGEEDAGERRALSERVRRLERQLGSAEQEGGRTDDG
ncbi:MAG TPA: gas vesicle protein [Conexibacter sp.]|nr:gas vesicle protein [Conexibacter sp.]